MEKIPVVLLLSLGLCGCAARTARGPILTTTPLRGSVAKDMREVSTYTFHGPPDALEQLKLRQKIAELVSKSYEDERQGINPHAEIDEIKRLAAKLRP